MENSGGEEDEETEGEGGMWGFVGLEGRTIPWLGCRDRSPVHTSKGL